MKENLTGKQFFDLTVKKSVGISSWECLCKCGKTIILQTWVLTSKHNKKSCGCKIHGKNNYLWKGHEEITGHYWSHITKDAKKRNLEFSITIQEAWNKFLKQKRMCALSSSPIYFPINTTTNASNYTASLDRIDSSQGYTKNNTQWVHKDINMMKHKFEQNYFIKWCKKITQYQREIQQGG